MLYEKRGIIMDEGARFVLDNFEKAIDLCKKNDTYRKHLRKIQLEYARLKDITKTGNMLDHFDKFLDNKHPNSREFLFLRNYKLLTNEDMSNYLRNNYQDEINNRITIKDIMIGEFISTGLLMNVFGVTYRGSLRRNIGKNLVVVIVDRKQNHNYMDEHGVVHYKATGNSFNYRTCKVVRDSLKNNTELYLFETWGNNRYYYFGQVVLDSKPEVDKNGDSFFKLRRIDINQKTIIDSDSYGAPTNKEVWSLAYVEKTSSNHAISLKPIGVVKGRKAARDPNVSYHAKRRADGKCDLCEKTPFKTRKGIPYLECHHMIFLSEGGPDRVYNVVALCPNCHRKMHYLADKGDVDTLISKINNYLVEEGSRDNIVAFKKLFIHR